jgi:hypothetical protein
MQPAEATVPIAAESPEQAKEILSKMFAARPNFQIHDIYNIKDCPELEEIMEGPEEIDEEPTKH